MLVGKVKAVLFDVGGVLHLPDHDTMRAFLGELGARLPDRVIDRAHYVAAALAEGWADDPHRADFEEYLRRYLFALGVPRHDLASAADRYMRELGTGKAWSAPVTAAAEMLRELAKSHLKLGLVSNTTAGGVADRLRASGLCQVGDGNGVGVEVVIDSHELGVRKPDPAIFQAALAALQLGADEVAFVGDALDADVMGARAVGMHPLHFDPLSLCGRSDHAHAESLREVPALVGSLGDDSVPRPRAHQGRLIAIEGLLEVVAGWAAGREDICGLCVVGSCARGHDTAGSDVDLVLLTTTASDYISDDAWIEAFPGFASVGTRGWGAITERRLRRPDGLELDVAIADPAWASTSPLDDGTRKVVQDGLRILHDPDGRLRHLVASCAGGVGS